eukprot:355745-Chlamydomonas_euryale.AAC.1
MRGAASRAASCARAVQAWADADTWRGVCPCMAGAPVAGTGRSLRAPQAAPSGTLASTRGNVRAACRPSSRAADWSCLSPLLPPSRLELPTGPHAVPSERLSASAGQPRRGSIPGTPLGRRNIPQRSHKRAACLLVPGARVSIGWHAEAPAFSGISMHAVAYGLPPG